MITELIKLLFISTIANNVVLTYFLGICSYIALSKDPKASIGMGLAVTLVNLITTTLNWFLYYYLLVPYKLEIYQYLVFIICIAFLVQLLEIILEYFFPNLFEIFGIYLPLVTVNCTIFGTSLFVIIRDYNLAQSIVFSLGIGLGWMLAILLLATINKHLIFCNVKSELGHVGSSLLISGIMAMAFSCFTSIIE